jgi:hypothetical protein
MNKSDLKRLSLANSRLPDNAYFAYEGIEVIEFHFLHTAAIELVNGVTLNAEAIVNDEFTMRFDNPPYNTNEH